MWYGTIDINLEVKFEGGFAPTVQILSSIIV